MKTKRSPRRSLTAQSTSTKTFPSEWSIFKEILLAEWKRVRSDLTENKKLQGMRNLVFLPGTPREALDAN